MNKKIALLSVYHKEGIVQFARQLVRIGWTILSSSGTFKTLSAAGVPVTDVAEITGQGPILGHRVVTLQPHIHGGLLAAETMLEELEALGYPWIDLVCVDLYPLKEEIAKPTATRESVIEKTDIGGPTMLRSGAKGRRIVICDPKDREKALICLFELADDAEWRNKFAAKAEAVISDYCLASARYHSGGEWDGVILHRVAECRYGENAWQTPAALYTEIGNEDPLALNHFQCVQGRAPSYNNWCDVDRALQTLTHIAAGFDVNTGKVPCIAVGVKHGNACGAAVGDDREAVIKDMLNGDPRAIFGGVVMTNFPLHEKLAELLRTNKDKTPRLLDLIAAPDIFPNSREILTWKEGRGALLCNPALATVSKASLDRAPRFRYVRGGALIQPNYTHIPVIAEMDFHMGEMDLAVPVQDAILAWAVCATSNSNTITIVKDGKLLGNGVGQQDRVGAAELAVKRAMDAGHSRDDLTYSVAWSDSFFPFPDGVWKLAEAGVTHILATSGSKRDLQVINAAVDACVSISLLPDAEARCFYGH